MTAGHRGGNNSHHDHRTLLSFHMSIRAGIHVDTETYVQISSYLRLRGPIWCGDKHGANDGASHIENIRTGN